MSPAAPSAKAGGGPDFKLHKESLITLLLMDVVEKFAKLSNLGNFALVIILH